MKGETMKMNRNGNPTIIKVGRLADGLSGVVQERMAVKVSGGGIEWVARQSELVSVRGHRRDGFGLSRSRH